jgi:hypothetical protein
VKALGEGLSRPLSNVSIDVDAAGRPCLLYDRNAPRPTARWQFQDIPIDATHVACVVTATPHGMPARAAVIRDL